MVLSFKILRLDINQSYFFGKVEHGSEEFKINVQNERRGKVLRLPFGFSSKKEKMIVRFTGPGDIFVEDYLPYRGESEWVEVDSDEITYFIADHQDQFDTLEIMDE
jgi:hypothetical protein